MAEAGICAERSSLHSQSSPAFIGNLFNKLSVNFKTAQMVKLYLLKMCKETHHSFEALNQRFHSIFFSF